MNRASLLRSRLMAAVCGLTLLAAAGYTYAQSCNGACLITGMGATESVTFPDASCPNLTHNGTYTFSSYHEFTANKTSGNGLACSINWSAKLQTNDGPTALNFTQPVTSTMNGSCGPVTFNTTISRSHTLPSASASLYDATATTTGPPSVLDSTSTCYKAN